MGLTVQIVALRKRARRQLRTPAAANAIVRPALGRDDPRDSDVAQALVRFGTVCIVKALVVLLEAAVGPVTGASGCADRRRAEIRLRTPA